MYFPKKKRNFIKQPNQLEKFLKNPPATNRLFTNDIRYPLPANSKSIPDNVVPSQLNWVVNIDGVDGPLVISNRARSVSMPELSECCEMSVKFHTNLFDSPSLEFEIGRL